MDLSFDSLTDLLLFQTRVGKKPENPDLGSDSLPPWRLTGKCDQELSVKNLLKDIEYVVFLHNYTHAGEI